MEALFAKMKEYVKMEEEISVAEFQAYYKSVMDTLQKEFESLSQEELLQAKIVTSIMASNALSRQKRKDYDGKKFKKMAEKSNFWSDAIKYKLKKAGLSESEIDQLTEEMEKAM